MKIIDNIMYKLYTFIICFRKTYSYLYYYIFVYNIIEVFYVKFGFIFNNLYYL